MVDLGSKRTASEAWLAITAEEQDLILKGMLASLSDMASRILIVDLLSEYAQERRQETSSPCPTVKR